MCLGRGADSRVMSTAHPIQGKARALWGAALPGPSFCGPHSVSLRAVEDRCPPGLWLSETDPDAAAGGMIAAQRTSPGDRGVAQPRMTPRRALPQTEQRDRWAVLLCHHHTHRGPSLGPWAVMLSPTTDPGAGPQRSGAVQALLRPCMAWVLYLACEKGSVGGGLRGRARQHHCASCPGPGASTAHPDPWPPTTRQAGTVRPHFTGADTEAAPRETRSRAHGPRDGNGRAEVGPRRAA